MDERVLQFRVGVMVVFVVMLTIILVVGLFTKSTAVFTHRYDVVILFPEGARSQ